MLTFHNVGKYRSPRGLPGLGVRQTPSFLSWGTGWRHHFCLEMGQGRSRNQPISLWELTPLLLQLRGFMWNPLRPNNQTASVTPPTSRHQMCHQHAPSLIPFETLPPRQPRPTLPRNPNPFLKRKLGVIQEVGRMREETRNPIYIQPSSSL